jgi:hypothetical protein
MNKMESQLDFPELMKLMEGKKEETLFTRIEKIHNRSGFGEKNAR